MLERLTRRLRQASGDSVTYDAAALNDPVALRTDWTAAVAGGANFRTLRLVFMGPERLEFRPTRITLGLLSIVPLIGTGIVASVLTNRTGDSIADSLALLFGASLVFAGTALVYLGTTPRVFDRKLRRYWKGRTPPTELPRNDTQSATNFSDFHALQIISEHIKSTDGSYFSHELNLVLKDGRRVNVTDHGDLSHLRHDARTLSHFLGLPLWDAARTAASTVVVRPIVDAL